LKYFESIEDPFTFEKGDILTFYSTARKKVLGKSLMDINIIGDKGFFFGGMK